MAPKSDLERASALLADGASWPARPEVVALAELQETAIEIALAPQPLSVVGRIGR